MEATDDPQIRKRISYALRHPRGEYEADRASQLSGVPKSTLYDWRRAGVYRPDFEGRNPTGWSYRDLVFLRLLAWLRQIGMERPKAAERVAAVRDAFSAGQAVRRVRATSNTLLLDEEADSRFGDPNLLPFEEFDGLLATFDLQDPIEELRRRGGESVWAPDLVEPSRFTFISPWVMAGDPCVRGTRIPTASIHALHEERGLGSAEIIELYPGLTVDAADDAFELERRLRDHGYRPVA